MRQASESDLSLLLKNGLRASLKNNESYGMFIRGAVAKTESVTDTGSSGSGFSTTNVQVQGVDESDSVKYDGKYIYIATPHEYTEAGASAALKILSTNADKAIATEVSNTPVDTSQWGGISELYLVSQNQATSGVVTLRRSWNFIAFKEKLANNAANPSAKLFAETDKMSSAAIWPYRMNNGIEVSIYDVRTPSTPSRAWTLTLDGDLLGSRKIGNTLYIVSSFVPSISTLEYGVDTEEKRIANETLIAQTGVEKLLPEYAINGGTAQPLNKTSGCLIPSDTKATDGYLNLVNITVIDLSAQQMVKSQCINASVEGVYSSLDSMYLGGSAYNDWQGWNSFTVMHKFALKPSDIAYEATGTVEGVLGWGETSFRMDEFNENLRVVTTTYSEQGEPTHHLNILRKAVGRSELASVAQLPNKQRPEPLGKPKEDIYAVRFNGNKAYVVTFERKDPLYVLDLSNPLDPSIAGELSIPGFSTYLQPIGDNFLFSLGNETDEKGRVSGLKVSLFDVRDMKKPTQVSNHVFGNASSWSDALYDHRALSWLQTSADQVRLVFPVNIYKDVQDGEFLTSRWQNNSLLKFEINGLANNKASLDSAGEIIGEDNSTQEYPQWTGVDRGLLHHNALYYVHGKKVIGDFWSKQ